MNLARKMLAILRAGCLDAFNKNIKCSILHSNITLLDEISAKEGGKIRIRKIDHSGKLSLLSTGGVVEIGSAYFNRHCLISCRKRIDIGNNCIFGPNVCIFDHDHKFGVNGYQSGYSCGEISIGNHVWIGANCVILKNTHIGSNCIIGAGCIIRGNIPDNSLVTMNRDLSIEPLVDTK